MEFSERLERDSEEQSSAGLLEEDEKRGKLLKIRKRSSPRVPSTLNTILMVTVLLLFMSNLGFIAQNRRKDDRRCIRQLSTWSPALDAVEYEEVHLHNAFDKPSEYRGPPTSKLEKAWQDLWRLGKVQVPEDRLSLLHKSEELDNVTYKRIPENLGGGFEAILEVTHHLHCLNLIRQYTWLQSGNYGPDSVGKVDTPVDLRSSDVGNRMHVDHCIETLRRVLMCHSDVTPMLSMESTESLIAKADFNLNMKCRNFAKVQNWIEANVKIPFGQLPDP